MAAARRTGLDSVDVQFRLSKGDVWQRDQIADLSRLVHSLQDGMAGKGRL